MRIDFHLHSNASDGAHPPMALAEAARSARLQAWALTDHDTLAGWRMIAGAPGLVPGVEASCSWNGREVHIVALGFDPAHPDLTDLLAGNRALRLQRLACLLDRLPPGIRKDTTVADVAALAANGPDGSLGRNHLAQTLVRSGAVSGSHEAFDRYLADEHLVDQGLPTFPGPEATAATIHAAGGVAILAHPGCYGDLPTIQALMACGLDGLETSHPNLPSPLAQGLRRVADRQGWLHSCGTDLHVLGHRRPGGCALGADRMRPLLQRLRVGIGAP